MNPDFAIVLNFKLKTFKNIDFDFLVKSARNLGARAISSNLDSSNWQSACSKYTVCLLDKADGADLNAENVIDTMMLNRKNGISTIINVPVTEDNSFDAATSSMLSTVNNWMHMFGHAFNEGHPSSLTIDNNGFVLENRHMPYQKYLFLKSPLPDKITVSGLTQKPNRIEMIEKRTEPKFTFNNGQLKIILDTPDNSFSWQVVRIQGHRPEDDIKETKF